MLLFRIMKKTIVIVGGGAAGLFAAYVLTKSDHNVILIEQNEKLGKKIYITGKGRCNLTNDSPAETLLANTVSNPKFLYSAVSRLDAKETMRHFSDMGLRMKTERGNRVFPVSDHASDVTTALERSIRKAGGEIWLNQKVIRLIVKEFADETDKKVTGRVCGLLVSDGKQEKVLDCDFLLLATGGVSYPTTGATGDGYRFAGELGLKVVDPRPALVPLTVREDFCGDLSGLSLKNVRLSVTALVKNKEKKICEDFGEMLYTHFGLSGPLVLSASSRIGKYLPGEVVCHIDLKPALTLEQLDARLLRDLTDRSNKIVTNTLFDLLPKSLLPYVLSRAGIDKDKSANGVTKEERLELARTLKDFTFHVTGTRGFHEAIITQGGLSVKEVDPSTMRVKKYRGLYAAGELLDLDAMTGGFNLQIAWSTGYAAACGILTDLEEEG